MKIHLTEIIKTFNNLIHGSKSREEIAFWASQRQSAHDMDDLEFIPFGERKRIWESIIY